MKSARGASILVAGRLKMTYKNVSERERVVNLESRSQIISPPEVQLDRKAF